METIMKRIKILIAFGILFGTLARPTLVTGCPGCSGSVPWTDGTNGEAESNAYNNSIYFMLAAPSVIVLGVAVALVRRNRLKIQDPK